jgi:hypothetical protein
MSARVTASAIAITAGVHAIGGALAASHGFGLPAIIAGGLLVAAGVLRAVGIVGNGNGNGNASGISAHDRCH